MATLRKMPGVADEADWVERRRYPRIPVNHPVRVYVEDDNGITLLRGLSDNLSLGGALLSVSEYLPRESRCDVKFVGASGSIVPNYVAGTVRRVTVGNDNDFLVGIEFSTPLAIIPATATT